PFAQDGETAGDLGFVPDYGNVTGLIGDVAPGSGAEAAGLKGGDQIVSAGGQPVKSSEQVVQYIRSHKNQPILMEVNRGGQRVPITAEIPPGPPVLGVHVGPR